jgi:hypothetical protein
MSLECGCLVKRMELDGKDFISAGGQCCAGKSKKGEWINKHLSLFCQVTSCHGVQKIW